MSVTGVLSAFGLNEPKLNVLAPTQANYTALLFQPEGNIEILHDRVRHSDRSLADSQFGAFLKEAVCVRAELVVTPEYSMPWETLEEQLSAGIVPPQGSVWVLGCESIKLDELKAIRGRLSPNVEVVFEELGEIPGRFLNPVAYIFNADRSGTVDSSQLVILLQFKICPMGDPDHFEVNRLQTGTRLYCFGNGTTQLRMATLICSDAFAFLDEHAKILYDRMLLLHIQLNPKPRQDQFRQYRSRIFQYGGGQTELICLNWANNVHEGLGDSKRCWENIAGSAWYLSPDKFDDSDKTLIESHRRGLYYTWLESLRCHALFFNYGPTVYRFTATKVAHIGVPASLSRRRGPQLTESRTWDTKSSSWTIQDSLDDGFSNIVGECGDAEPSVAVLAANNPFHAERVLALCAGKIEVGVNWHALNTLDSCAIDSSEVVRRITVCQDPDAHEFRVERLRRCRSLFRLLQSSLPPGIADLQDGFDFGWDPNSPHQNVVSAEGRRATVIYLADSCNDSQVQAIAKQAEDYLGQSLSDPNEIMEARQRLQVWYRDDDGNDVTVDSHPYIDYDDPRSGSRAMD